MALESVGLLSQRQPPEYTYVPGKPREGTPTAEVSSAYSLTPFKSGVVYVAPLQMVYRQPHMLGAPGAETWEQLGRPAILALTWGIVEALASQSVLEEVLNRASQRLGAFLTLGEGWYFHGAHAISPATVDRAKQLLSSLRSLSYDEIGKKVEPYAIAPLVTGGIQLEWQGDRGNLEVEVGPQDHLSYLLEPRQGPEEEGSAAPEQFLDLLRRIL